MKSRLALQGGFFTFIQKSRFSVFPFLIRQTIFGPKGIENTGKMEIAEIQRYKIALERLKQLSDIRLGKPLLIQTLMGNLRVLHSNHIGYFKYISTKKSWEIALTDGSFVRLKGNLRAKNLCAYNDRFIQIHQSYIINIQYLCMIQNNHCIMYPPFIISMNYVSRKIQKGADFLFLSVLKRIPQLTMSYHSIISVKIQDIFP